MYIGLTAMLIAVGASAATLQEDLEFLSEHTDIVVLRSPSGDGRAIVTPAWQGRVMTSSAEGTNGYSMGWVNREFIAAGEPGKAFSPYGGEDRFWLGPEAGPFALFFGEDEPFDMEHWQTPAPLDKEAYKVTRRYTSKVELNYVFEVTNATGTVFTVELERKIELLDKRRIAVNVGVAAPEGVSVVAIETENKIINAGAVAWEKATGLPSVWMNVGVYRQWFGTSASNDRV